MSTPLLQETSQTELKKKRRSFEAGGTTLWGAEFDDEDTDSDTSSLSPIREDDGTSSDEAAADRISQADGGSLADSIGTSPGPMRRHQSEFRATLLKHKQRWQRAAQQAKQGGSVHRRRSILPIEDITMEPFQKISNASADDDDDISAAHVHKISGRFTATLIPEDDLTKTPINSHHHPPALPVSSLDIEQNIKPQLQPARTFLGFMFPKLPTEFAMSTECTTNVNESLYQRYYSTKKKNAIFTVNILYSVLLLVLLCTKVLLFRTTQDSMDVVRIVREVAITVFFIINRCIVCIIIRRANSPRQVRVGAYYTWAILGLENLTASLTSFIDFESKSESLVAWNQFGTWQMILAMFTTLVSLSVIPFQQTIVLSVTIALVHVLTSAVLTAVYDLECLARVSSSDSLTTVTLPASLPISPPISPPPISPASVSTVHLSTHPSSTHIHLHSFCHPRLLFPGLPRPLFPHLSLRSHLSSTHVSHNHVCSVSVSSLSTLIFFLPSFISSTFISPPSSLSLPPCLFLSLINSVRNQFTACITDGDRRSDSFCSAGDWTCQ